MTFRIGYPKLGHLHLDGGLGEVDLSLVQNPSCHVTMTVVIAPPVMRLVRVPKKSVIERAPVRTNTRCHPMTSDVSTYGRPRHQ